MLSVKDAIEYHEGPEAADAAEWFAASPEPDTRVMPRPVPLLSDIDKHWQTGEEIWEIEHDTGHRQWMPAAEAKVYLERYTEEEQRAYGDWLNEQSKSLCEFGREF